MIKQSYLVWQRWMLCEQGPSMLQRRAYLLKVLNHFGGAVQLWCNKISIYYCVWECNKIKHDFQNSIWTSLRGCLETKSSQKFCDIVVICMESNMHVNLGVLGFFRCGPACCRGPCRHHHTAPFLSGKIPFKHFAWSDYSSQSCGHTHTPSLKRKNLPVCSHQWPRMLAPKLQD